MSTIPASPTLGDLQLGTPRIEPFPTETIQILMKTRKVDPNGQVCTTGNTFTVPRGWGILAVESGWASFVSGIPLPNRTARSVDEMRNAVGTFSYDGSNRLTGFVADGIKYTVQYPNSTTIDVYVGANGRRITLNGLQQVVGVAPL